jgi:hypothetical protein
MWHAVDAAARLLGVQGAWLAYLAGERQVGALAGKTELRRKKACIARGIFSGSYRIGSKPTSPAFSEVGRAKGHERADKPTKKRRTCQRSPIARGTRAGCPRPMQFRTA